DGIRDFHVTGVQTCALPIFGGYFCADTWTTACAWRRRGKVSKRSWDERIPSCCTVGVSRTQTDVPHELRSFPEAERQELRTQIQIGRASCRERGSIWVVGG